MTGKSASVPAADLYWALLDPAPLGRKAIRPEERGFLFEAELPLAIEELHCAYAPLKDGRILACAIDRERLAILAGALHSLAPESVPDWLSEEVRAQAQPSSLELLRGEFEPRAARRARRIFALTVAASVALASAIFAMGVLGRAKALDRAAALADTRRDELVQAALAGSPKRPGLPDDLRLLAELRELRGTRSTGAPTVEDASPVLAAMLAAWPEGVGAQVDSVAVSGAKISIHGQALTAPDLQAIADGVGAIPGWRAKQPVFRTAKDGLAFAVEAESETKPRAKGGEP